MSVSIDPAIDLDASLFGGQAFTWWRGPRSLDGVIQGTFMRIDPATRYATCAPTRPADWIATYLGRRRTRPRALADDDQLADLATRLSGLRLLEQDPWEATAAFMLSPVNNVPRIQENIARLSREHGRPLDGAFAFPFAERVAALDDQQLGGLRLGFRGPRLVRLAQAVTAGALDLQRLQRRPIVEAREVLTAHDGIGPKVAECILCYALGFDDAFPTDRWVNRATAAIFDEPLSPDEARDRWGKKAAMAQQLLFHGARMGLVDGVRASPVARFGSWRPLSHATPRRRRSSASR